MDQKDNSQVLKKDPFLPFIFKFLILYRNIKHLCLISTLVLIIVSVLQTYQLYRNPSPKIVLKYGTFYFACIYAVCINIIYIRVAKSVNNDFSSYKSLFTVNTVHIVGKTSAKIKVLASKTNGVLAIWLTTAFCALEAMYYNWMLDKNETMLITVFLKQNTNCNSFVIELINHAALISVHSICICSTVPMYFIYIIFYLKLNLIILTDQVKRFRNDLKRSDGPRFMQTEDVIQFITREYLKINRFNLDISAKLQVDCVLFISSGFLVGFMGCCAVFSSNRSILEATALFTTYFSFGLTVCAYVQTYENDSVDLYYAILDLNWYEWNVEYQKMYLLVVTNACKVVHIKLFWMVDINHELLKKIWRMTYAAINFFYSIG